ncbi:MAG: undecaprenyl-phosphate glucose phosphotransferase [Filomicrobium sp.]
MSDITTIDGRNSSEGVAGALQAPSDSGFAHRFPANLFLDGHGALSLPKLLFTVAFIDAICVFVSGWIVVSASGVNAAVSSTQSFYAGLIVSLAAVLLLRSHWSYSIAAFQDRSGQISKVTRAMTVLLVALAGAAHILSVKGLEPHILIVWMGLSFIGLVCVRLVVEQLVLGLSRAGVLSRRTVIVGSGKDADDLVAALTKSGQGQVDVLGYFDDRNGARSGDGASQLQKLGNFDQLASYCQDEAVDLVLVSIPLRAEDRLLQILQELFAIRVDIRVSALNAKLRLNSNAYKYIGDVPVLAVMDKPLNDWDRALKNIFDRLMALAILCLAAPVMALVALAVRLESKGPILFKQRRYGFNNELVEVYKFRSMYADQSDANAAKLVTKGDPRVTKVGRIIRKTSLDELPQLLNVLTGEMSLVGPRPHATQAKAGSSLYQDVVQGYLARHRVKPGITGWAQICGWRGETDTADKIQRRVECDLFYIDNWSVRFDLYIVAMTPFVLLSGKNAY